MRDKFILPLQHNIGMTWTCNSVCGRFGRETNTCHYRDGNVYCSVCTVEFKKELLKEGNRCPCCNCKVRVVGRYHRHHRKYLIEGDEE